MLIYIIKVLPVQRIPKEVAYKVEVQNLESGL